MRYVGHNLASFDGHGRRLMGIGGVVLVHLVLIVFILSGLPKVTFVRRAAQELFLDLMPKPKPKPREKSLLRDTTIHPILRYPTYLPEKSLPAAPTAKALSVPLFRCAPENFDKLSLEDQRGCAGTGILPPDNTAIALRSHVLDPLRRSEELAARKSPARVNCTRMETQVIDNIAQQHNLIVDPLCAGRALLQALRR